MSKISGKENKLEISIRRCLFSMGIRYRKNYAKLPGKPDIVLTKYKVAIFINGCFWHGHNCTRGTLPTSNIEFWKTKISKNKKRDAKILRQLKKLRWRVVTLWQCELNTKKKCNTAANDLLKYIFLAEEVKT